MCTEIGIVTKELAIDFMGRTSRAGAVAESIVTCITPAEAGQTPRHRTKSGAT